MAGGRRRFVLVGEGMLELSATTGDLWNLRYGGDTLNTAIHLARLEADVAFGSALGDDRFGHELRERWTGEGVDCSLVLTDPDRNTGLYAIVLDEDGERSFVYWRNDSAARAMFTLPGIEKLHDAIARTDCLVFSLISLAILRDHGRTQLLELARSVRKRGGVVAFDGNYRPRLWPSADEAAKARDAAIAVASIGLPTLSDEAALEGSSTHDGEAVVAHWRKAGCDEVVVKLGDRGCLLDSGEMIAPERSYQPIDTSGAGDAFNAGYLAERLDGGSQRKSARAGHRLAGWTIMRPGAIPPRDRDAPYSPKGHAAPSEFPRAGRNFDR